MASCAASRASSRLPMIRRQMLTMRSAWRERSVSRAARSPCAAARASTASVTPDSSAGNPNLVELQRHGLGEACHPDEDIPRRCGAVEDDGGRAGGGRDLADRAIPIAEGGAVGIRGVDLAGPVAGAVELDATHGCGAAEVEDEPDAALERKVARSIVLGRPSGGRVAVDRPRR